jgi:hypothetical protein
MLRFKNRILDIYMFSLITNIDNENQLCNNFIYANICIYMFTKNTYKGVFFVEYKLILSQP